ncbi:MAG: acyl-phosphate glycerol 3-phosphate acyltransferase [Chloroflexi bacterium]|nr:acyl-phosphate glycerol 3-phosphate acyltransferase [Chloroflexota bacterium]|tara:strand:- start:4237 stop:4842 length:606 start_codon:yes stop_codon:yes gene_type:complete
MTNFIIFGTLSYLIGAIPIGLILSKSLRGIDIRNYGSGSIGMSNIQRNLGNFPAAVVLTLDMTKSFLPILYVRYFLPDPQILETISALGALTGHCWPIFAKFRGGRGVATGWGSLLILSPITGIISGIIGIPIIIMYKFISLGSIIGATSGCISMMLLSITRYHSFEYLWYALLGNIIVVYKHKENIQRLLEGTERKIGKA